jgi:hypothetical protein
VSASRRHSSANLSHASFLSGLISGCLRATVVGILTVNLGPIIHHWPAPSSGLIHSQIFRISTIPAHALRRSRIGKFSRAGPAFWLPDTDGVEVRDANDLR